MPKNMLRDIITCIIFCIRSSVIPDINDSMKDKDCGICLLSIENEGNYNDLIEANNQEKYYIACKSNFHFFHFECYCAYIHNQAIDNNILFDPKKPEAGNLIKRVHICPVCKEYILYDDIFQSLIENFVTKIKNNTATIFQKKAIICSMKLKNRYQLEYFMSSSKLSIDEIEDLINVWRNQYFNSSIPVVLEKIRLGVEWISLYENYKDNTPETPFLYALLDVDNESLQNYDFCKEKCKDIESLEILNFQSFEVMLEIFCRFLNLATKYNQYDAYIPLTAILIHCKYYKAHLFSTFLKIFDFIFSKKQSLSINKITFYINIRSVLKDYKDSIETKYLSLIRPKTRDIHYLMCELFTEVDALLIKNETFDFFFFKFKYPISFCSKNFEEALLIFLELNKNYNPQINIEISRAEIFFKKFYLISFMFFCNNFQYILNNMKNNRFCVCVMRILNIFQNEMCKSCLKNNEWASKNLINLLEHSINNYLMFASNCYSNYGMVFPNELYFTRICLHLLILYNKSLGIGLQLIISFISSNYQRQLSTLVFKNLQFIEPMNSHQLYHFYSIFSTIEVINQNTSMDILVKCLFMFIEKVKKNPHAQDLIDKIFYLMRRFSFRKPVIMVFLNFNCIPSGSIIAANSCFFIINSFNTGLISFKELLEILYFFSENFFIKKFSIEKKLIFCFNLILNLNFHPDKKDEFIEILNYLNRQKVFELSNCEFFINLIHKNENREFVKFFNFFHRNPIEELIFKDFFNRLLFLSINLLDLNIQYPEVSICLTNRSYSYEMLCFYLLKCEFTSSFQINWIVTLLKHIFKPEIDIGSIEKLENVYSCMLMNDVRFNKAQIKELIKWHKKIQFFPATFHSIIITGIFKGNRVSYEKRIKRIIEKMKKYQMNITKKILNSEKQNPELPIPSNDYSKLSSKNILHKNLQNIDESISKLEQYLRKRKAMMIKRCPAN